MPACGCSGCSARHRPALVVERACRGRAAPPRRSAARRWSCSSRAVAGTVPVDPAAMTGCGEPLASRSVSQRHQQIAARDRRDETVIGEIARPLLGDDLEELDGDLPMPGEFLGHDVRRAAERSTSSRLDHVHEPGEVGGKIGRLARRHARRSATRDRRARPPPRAQADARRRARAASAPGVAAARRWRARRWRRHPSETILGPEDDGRVLVGIAERPDARQEQRLALGSRRERPRAARAPRGGSGR